MSIVFNLIVCWMCWRVGSDALDDDRPVIGWLGIALSATNFAAAMSNLL